MNRPVGPIDIGANHITLMIWDVLGQHGYTNTHTSSFDGAHGAILVADFTRRETLINLRDHWLRLLHRTAGQVPVVFIANKTDLVRQRQFREEDIRNMAFSYRAGYFLTSAKTGSHVEEAFQFFGKVLLKSPAPPAPGVEMPRARYRVTSEIQAADAIIDHFCGHCVDRDWAMAVVRKAFERAGVDIKAPTAEGLRRVLAHLEAVERDFQGESVARGHRATREKYLVPLGVQ